MRDSGPKGAGQRWDSAVLLLAMSARSTATTNSTTHEDDGDRMNEVIHGKA